jgi:curved DNA-binding protein CbpA
MSAKSFYAILGVEETAPTERIISAYRGMVKARHPDHFTDPAERAAAEIDFREITAAYNTLRAADLRREYDRARKAGTSDPSAQLNPEQEARQAMARGMKKFEAKDFFGAYQEFEKALTHKPGWAEAHFQLGLVCLKNSQWKRRGVENIEKAIELDGGQPQYYVQLINIYLEAGLKSRAQHVLATARNQFPANAAIDQIAAAVEGGDKSADGGGLLGIFKKRT